MFNLSRYWNKCVYKLVDLARWLLWDYTGMNSDILGNEFANEVTREIMTTPFKPRKKAS
jgi:hypothetical protein